MQTPQERSNSFAFENIPQEIKPLKQWLIWKLTDQGKIPHSPFTGGNCDANDHSNFATFDTAHKAYNKFKLSGIGLAPGNGYALIDFDECISDQGQIDPNVWHIIELLNSYTEITPSGKGIRIIVKAKLAFGRKNFPSYSGFKGEIYVSKGYCTITGNQLPNTPNTINDVSSILNEWLAKIFKEHTNGKTPNPATTTGGDNSNLTLQLAKRQLDRELVTNSALAKVWHGQANYKSNSEAVYGLRLDLLRLTYGNEQLANQLFQLSPLYQTNPKKWDRLTQYDYPKALDQIKTEIDQPTQTQHSWLSLDQLFALPNPEFLLDYKIAKWGINAIIGDTANGKTFWLVDAGLRLATENNLNVLYVAAENVQGVALRVKAWCQYHKLKPDTFLVYPKAINLMNGDTEKFLIEIVSLPIDVIIYDTFSMCIPGANENASNDMTLAVYALQKIQQAKNCTTLLGHHTTKDGIRERGHGSFKAALDHMLYITKLADSLTIEYVKTRHIENPVDDSYKLEKVIIDNAFHKDGTPLTSAVILSTQGERQALTFKLSNDALQILAILNDNGSLLRKDINKLLRWHNNRLSDAINTLKGRKYIEKSAAKDPYALTETGRLFYEKSQKK